MQSNKFLLALTSLILFYLTGCAPSSYTLRYKNYSNVATHEDSVKVGLIGSDDDLLYYSQVQDTSSEFQDWEFTDEDNSDEPNPVDVSAVFSKIKSSINSSDTTSISASLRDRMLMEIIKYMDTPYKYGGNSHDGIDCSAFTQNVYSNCLGINLLRSAREQFTQGLVIKEKSNLVFGDLLFFNTRRGVRPGHVGIYIGDNLFAHASSTKGVIVSSLDHHYYSKRFMGGRRIDNIFSQN